MRIFPVNKGLCSAGLIGRLIGDAAGGVDSAY